MLAAMGSTAEPIYYPIAALFRETSAVRQNTGNVRIFVLEACENSFGIAAIRPVPREMDVIR